MLCVVEAATALTPFLLFKAASAFCAPATAVGCGSPDVVVGCEPSAVVDCVCFSVREDDLLGGSSLFGIAEFAGCEAAFATTTGEAMRGVAGASRWGESWAGVGDLGFWVIRVGSLCAISTDFLQGVLADPQGVSVLVSGGW